MKLRLSLFMLALFFIYSALVYTRGTECATVKMSEEAIAGKMLYQKFNCTACHQLYGLGGYLGPELTTVMRQPGRELYARAILKTGTQRMPDFHLTENEVSEFAEYLKYVDATATTYKTKK